MKTTTYHTNIAELEEYGNRNERADLQMKKRKILSEFLKTSKKVSYTISKGRSFRYRMKEFKDCYQPKKYFATRIGDYLEVDYI